MRRAALATAAVGVLLAVIAPAQVAPAQTPPALRSYSAIAAADAVRTSVFVPDFLIVSDVVDLGAPSAQAAMSSLGTANGFAAALYPGATTLSLGPTLAAMGALPPVPPYPLIASSDTTTPEQEVSGNTYTLTSRSAVGSVEASAEVGATRDTGSAASRATTALGEDGASVVAEATTVSTGFSIANLLTMGQATSTARVVARPDQPPELSQTFAVDGLSLAGVPVRLTTEGLEVASALTPLPIGDLVSQLASQGVTVRVLEPIETEHGIVAGGLTISYPASIPGGPQVIVTVQVGRASADATATAGVDDPEPDQAPTATTSGQATPSAPATSGPSVGSGPRPTGDAPSGTAAPSPISSQTSPRSFPSYWSMYLVVVAAAVAMAAATQVVRLFGVKLWIS